MDELKDGQQRVMVEEKNGIYFSCVKRYWITITSGTHRHGYSIAGFSLDMAG